VFSGYKVIETGIKHGTVTVIVDTVPLEITTFRIDGVYSDNRRPDSVEFTSDLELDLSRRDFTVNAMAYAPGRGVVDPFERRAGSPRAPDTLCGQSRRAI
jgi:tRNA nucleotidyltransferase (CCA-adding enzyme)